MALRLTVFPQTGLRYNPGMTKRSAVVAALLALLICCSCTVYKDRPAKSIADATGGEDLERAFWTQVQRKDWKDVEAHLASNFVAITSSGVLNHAAMLEYLKALQVRDFSLGDVQTELNGNTFVVAYNLVLSRESDAQDTGGTPQRVLTIWQQQKKGWVQIAHSVLRPEGK